MSRTPVSLSAKLVVGFIEKNQPLGVERQGFEVDAAVEVLFVGVSVRGRTVERVPSDRYP